MALLLVCNIAFFVLMALLLPMRYEENDDVMMCMIANGTYAGVPDCHLVYINVIYGALLAWLYSLTTAVEWYTLAFVVLHIVSMTVLSYCLLTIPNRARWERVLWMLALYVLWARIIAALQFTTTAGLVCLAGCVLLMRGTPRSEWVGAALVLVASLVRFVAAGLVGLLMAPIIIYLLSIRWRSYVPVVVMLVLVVGCRMTNRYVYDRDPEWRYYREYNQLRAQLNDNPNAYSMDMRSRLPEGIDIIDYALLLRFIPDPEQMDLKVMRQLSATVGEVPFRRQLANLHRLDRYAVEITILFALLVLMILTTGNRKKYIFLILYMLFVAALIVHVSLDGFLKNRVFLCMLTPILVTYFALLPDTTGKKRRWGIGIAMSVLCGWYGWQICYRTQQSGHLDYQLARLQEPILAYVPERAYVITLGTTMNMQAANPWHVWPYLCRKYSLGWMTCIPFNTPVASSYRGLLREDMYIFAPADYNRERTAIVRIREQIEKHYGVRTYVRPVCHNGAYALIQIKAIGEIGNK